MAQSQTGDYISPALFFGKSTEVTSNDAPQPEQGETTVSFAKFNNGERMRLAGGESAILNLLPKPAGTMEDKVPLLFQPPTLKPKSASPTAQQQQPQYQPPYQAQYPQPQYYIPHPQQYHQQQQLPFPHYPHQQHQHQQQYQPFQPRMPTHRAPPPPPRNNPNRMGGGPAAPIRPVLPVRPQIQLRPIPRGPSFRPHIQPPRGNVVALRGIPFRGQPPPPRAPVPPPPPPPPPIPTNLSIQFKSAKSVEDIIRFCLDPRIVSNMDNPAAATAVQYMGRLRRDAGLARTYPRIEEATTNLLRNCLGRTWHHHLATLIIKGMADGRLNELVPRALFSQLLQEIISKAKWNEFEAKELSHAAWSMAILRLPNQTIFNNVASQCQTRKFAKFNPVDICNVLWSFTLLNIRMPSLYDVAKDEIIRRQWRGFNAQDLSQICWAFSVAPGVGFSTKEPFFVAIAEEYVRRGVKTMSPADLGRLLGSFTNARVSHRELFDTVARDVMRRKFVGFSCMELSRLVWFFATVRQREESGLFDQVANECIKRGLREFTMQGLCLLIWSYSKLHIPAPGLYDEVVKEVKRRGSAQLNLQDIATLAWTYGNVKMANNKELFDVLANECVKRGLANFANRQIAQLVTSFARAGVMNEELMDKISLECLKRGVAKMAPKDIVDVVQAYGMVDRRAQALCESVAKEYARRGLDDMASVFVVIMTYSLAKQGVKNEAFYNAVVKKFVKEGGGGLSSPHLQAMRWVFGIKLSVGHDELIKVLDSEAARRGLDEIVGEVSGDLVYGDGGAVSGQGEDGGDDGDEQEGDGDDDGVLQGQLHGDNDGGGEEDVDDDGVGDEE